MRIRQTIMPLVAGLGLMAAGCRKGEDYSIVTQDWLVTNPSATPIAQAIRGLAPAPGQDTAVAGRAVGLGAGPRVLLLGPKDSATGVPLRATDSVQITYQKLTSVADYILAGRPTLAPRQVVALQGGVLLHLLAGGRAVVAGECRVALPLPEAVPTASLGTYVGYTNSQGRNLWGAIVPSDTAWRVRGGYQLPAEGTQPPAGADWLTFRTFDNRYAALGCGSLVPPPADPALVRVSLPGRFSPTNTQVFAMSDDGRRVFQLDPETSRVEFMAAYPWAAGAPVVLVAVAKIGPNWYMSRVRTTANALAAVEMYPDSLSQADLLSRLQNLPN